MFGPYRTAGKVDEKQISYPRIVHETVGAIKRRVVETEHGKFVIERLSEGKDSMGGDSNYWLREWEGEDNLARYQSHCEGKLAVWLIQQLDARR